ncbi:MAG: ATP-grasp domain-containing protein [Pseudomonadota bacterium]
MKKSIIIIDPMISAEYLIQQCKEFNYSTIAFSTWKSNKDVEHYFDYTHLPFAKIIKSSGNLQKDIDYVKSLEQYDIIAGFTGTDGAINYGEQFLQKLLPKLANDPTTSDHRSNKFAMNDVLKKHQLPYLKQEKIDQNLSDDQKIEQAFAFFQAYKNIIIKPAAGSAGSVNVFSPQNRECILIYFKNFKALYFSSDFLLQEKAIGPEYYVNCASYKGQHYVATIGQYVKTEVKGIFEYGRLDAVEKSSPQFSAIRTYALECLNVLGMLNGLSHTEIIMTNNGPRLIELNPRISGLHGYVNMMTKRKYDVDQISAYINLLENKKIPNINRPVHQRIFMFKNKKGYYNDIDLSVIKRLDSYVIHKIVKPKCENHNEESQNVLSLVMFILLEHTDKDILERDCDFLSALEKEGSCLIDH